MALIIDAGGTSSRFFLKHPEDHDPVLEVFAGFNWSRDDHQKLVSQCHSLKTTPSTVVAFIAGLLGEEERRKAERLLQGCWQDARIEAWPDYAAPLYQSENGAIALLAGTGCVVASKSEDGYVKTGGWGPLVGDFGSGFDLGRKGLWSCACGNWKNDRFSCEVANIFGSNDPSRFMTAAAQTENVRKVASLAEVMLQLAEGGEPTAREAAQQTAASQARLVIAHCERLNLPEEGELILYGSLVTQSDTMRKLLEQELKQHGASFSFTMLTEEQMLSDVASYALNRDRL